MVQCLIGARRRLFYVVEHACRRTAWCCDCKPQGSSYVPRAMLLVPAPQDKALLKLSTYLRSCVRCERYAKAQCRAFLVCLQPLAKPEEGVTRVLVR